MHLETFIPVFLMFAVFGLIMPIILSGVAEKGRNHG